MYFLLLLPSFLLFLYALYKLTKDDYVFIRRNITHEQIFDAAFTVTWVSLLFARIDYFIFHPVSSSKNVFISFFTPTEGGFSLIGAVLGGTIALYFIGKYKKVTLGRLFDFFVLSLLVALPLGFLSSAILLRGYELIVFLVNGFIYLILSFTFFKFFYPKLLNRTMKEGNLSIYFLIFFSLTSFVTTILSYSKGLVLQFTFQSLLPVLLFIIGLLLFFKQESKGLRVRKYK